MLLKCLGVRTARIEHILMIKMVHYHSSRQFTTHDDACGYAMWFTSCWCYVHIANSIINHKSVGADYSYAHTNNPASS